ncbi:MAG: nitroreductase [Actinomycetota bacterium]|nr:nitroreductase [Actinomycetota bacterium]
MTGAVAPPAAGANPAPAGDQAFDPALVARLVAIAGRAPSLHNTQPWRWQLERDRLELRADRDRQLLVADPDGHSLRISCGAALALAELAFAGEGWLMHVERLPDPDQPDLLARFTNPRVHQGTAAERDALAAASRRYSERRPFLPRVVPEDLVETLRAAASGEGVRAHFPVREAEKLNLAVAVSWADRIERRDTAYIAEMTRWQHDADVHTEGIPSFAIPHVPAGHPRHTDIPLRDFEVGRSGRDQIEADVDERPLIAVLLTDSDTPAEQLAAGESMMRLMLHADNAGLASCPLSQAVDLVAFRARVQTLMGWGGYPQMMLRIGYPPADRLIPQRSPRRPVADQLDIAETGSR